MSDGNLDTRSSAKKIFRTLVSHERFDSLIVDHYLADIYRDSKDKLDAVKKQINLMKWEFLFSETKKSFASLNISICTFNLL